jgi:AcrR family transcriptional regulator
MLNRDDIGEVPLTRQDRAERTRNAILDAAAQVFDERGFNGASLSEILSRAGVTKGALYFHFSSKEDLAKAITDEQLELDLPVITNPSTALQGLIDASHVFGQSLYGNVRVRASNRLVVESNFARPVPEVYRHWLKIFEEYLIAAKVAGDLRSEWEPKEAATWLGGSYLGVQIMSDVLTHRDDLRDRITELWRFSLPGLVPPRRLARFVPSGTISWDKSGAA